MRQILQIAAGECLRHPWRTVLVCQGLLWAVVMIVLPAAVIEGSRRQALDRSGELGTDLLQLEGSPQGKGAGALQESDLEPLAAVIEPSGSFSALRARPFKFVRPTAGLTTDSDLSSVQAVGWLIGSDESLPQLRGMQILSGEWPRKDSTESGCFPVAVERRFAEEFLPESPLGSRLRLRKAVGRGPSQAPNLEFLPANSPAIEAPAITEFVVVGVVDPDPVDEENTDRFGLDRGRSVSDLVHELMETVGISVRPVPYLQSGQGIFVDRSVVEGSRIDWIYLRDDPQAISETEDRIEALLVERGRVPLIYSNAAWSILSRPELDGYLVLHQVFFWLATGIGLVMLANLLLLAASHRRREIALRQAEGARRSDIFAQFLAEGAILSIVGIVLGVLIGMALARIRVEIDPSAVLGTRWPWKVIAQGSAILIVGALVAALIPAWRATRHAPAELFRRSQGKVSVGRGPLLRHPGRSALLILTFALGFASVLAGVATMEGGRQNIRKDALALGVDVIACLNPVSVGPIQLLLKSGAGARRIDESVIEELAAELDGEVRATLPFRMELARLYLGERSSTSSLLVTTPEFEGVLKAGLISGRFFNHEDLKPRETGEPTPVVLDEALARDFDAQDPSSLVGAELRLFRDGKLGLAKVIGVFKDPISLRKHLDAFDSQASARSLTSRRLEFKNVYLPWQKGLDQPSGVVVQLYEPGDADVLAPRIKQFFADREMEPYLHVQQRWVEFILEMVDRFSSLSYYVWAVNLLMVVMLTATISLLSVSDRFPEVALRRAEGATRWQVVRPLFVEATLLALLAMPLGLGIGLLILEFGVEPILDWSPYLPPLAVWGTPGLVILAAWLAHGIPARRIAQLDPARVLSNSDH